MLSKAMLQAGSSAVSSPSNEKKVGFEGGSATASDASAERARALGIKSVFKLNTSEEEYAGGDMFTTEELALESIESTHSLQLDMEKSRGSDLARMLVEVTESTDHLSGRSRRNSSMASQLEMFESPGLKTNKKQKRMGRAQTVDDSRRRVGSCLKRGFLGRRYLQTFQTRIGSGRSAPLFDVDEGFRQKAIHIELCVKHH